MATESEPGQEVQSPALGARGSAEIPHFKLLFCCCVGFGVICLALNVVLAAEWPNPTDVQKGILDKLLVIWPLCFAAPFGLLGLKRTM